MAKPLVDVARNAKTVSELQRMAQGMMITEAKPPTSFIERMLAK